MRQTQPNDDERAVSHRHRQLNSGLKSDCGGEKTGSVAWMWHYQRLTAFWEQFKKM